MTELSIIIVNFNTKNLVIDCIESIINSNSKIQHQIIVVDNGSSDGSVSAIRKLKVKTNNLILIENKNNLGFAKANNQGIKKAAGKYILLLNSDTKVLKGTIDKLYDFAKITPNVGVVGPNYLNPDGSNQGSCFRLPTLGRTISQYWFGKRGLLDKYSPPGENPQEVEAITMAGFLITPECIKRVGLINEKYFMYFEDLDYCRAVRKSGLKVYFLPSAKIIHYHGASGRKIKNSDYQWRRLIPSSKIYHGTLMHYLLNMIIKTGQIVNRYES